MTPVVFGGNTTPFRRALSLMVGLYSAAGIHPEVLQAITSSLLCAEAKFSVSHFRLPRP
jgi:hypothetical protein